jgi:hypothetical protein
MLTWGFCARACARASRRRCIDTTGLEVFTSSCPTSSPEPVGAPTAANNNNLINERAAPMQLKQHQREKGTKAKRRYRIAVPQQTESQRRRRRRRRRLSWTCLCASLTSLTSDYDGWSQPCQATAAYVRPRMICLCPPSHAVTSYRTSREFVSFELTSTFLLAHVCCHDMLPQNLETSEPERNSAQPDSSGYSTLIRSLPPSPRRWCGPADSNPTEERLTYECVVQEVVV